VPLLLFFRAALAGSSARCAVRSLIRPRDAALVTRAPRS
jgi:hypothetical protein